MRCASPPVLLVLLASLLPACVDPPDAPDEARGPISLTTWSNGAITGAMTVYADDGDGLVRGAYVSDARGALTLDVADGWSISVVDVASGGRRVATIAGVVRGAHYDLGDQRAIGGALPAELEVAPLAPAGGAASYAVSVCGPTIARAPVPDVAAGATIAYRPEVLDDGGGALLVAEADTGAYAVIDAGDVGALDAPVAFPPWQEARASARWFVAAPPDAIRIELSMRSAHGCAIGGGAATGADVDASWLAGLPVEDVSGTAWYRDDPQRTSRATRRVRADELPDDALDLAAPPARVDDVWVETTDDAMLVDWTESGGAGGGDTIEIATAPAPDVAWTVVAPRGDTHFLLPQVPEVTPAEPAWTTVTLVDSDGGWRSTGKFQPLP